MLRNTVMVKLFIPVLQIKLCKSTRGLHSTFQLWDSNKYLHFPTVEEEYQRLGDEIPQKLRGRVPRKRTQMSEVRVCRL